VSNTLYVGHQNNVLFSVLAQFFGKEAMNMRLFLFETHEFVTTPDKMLNVLIRTASDRSVGMVLFGNYYMMDYELMGSDGRKAIIAEDKKYGIQEFLPPLVPFESTEWPFRIDPTQGQGRPCSSKSSKARGCLPAEVLIRGRKALMNLNTINEVITPSKLNGKVDWREGDAWLAGGTWLFSEMQPHLRRLIDARPQLGAANSY